MPDISGFGGIIQLVASVTFPAGISLSQFADDTDPFDPQVLEIGDAVMGVNGDLATFSKANPLVLNISFFPQTDDDNNMQVLFDANRVAKGKRSVQDIITLTIIYPNGKPKTYNNGKIISGIPGDAIASSSRLKTKPYGFKFESIS